ncbi:MAG: hypothetical protein LC754_14465 [Acidobacteria bacterium]|nr:hypothetical protein [Acidobacteriota bacterium]
MREKLMAGLCVLLLTGMLALPVAASQPGAARAREGAHAERVRPAGEVVVVLSEEFFNALLDAITSQPNPPTFPLSRRGGAESSGKGCVSELTLLRESKGTRTAVRFDAGRITAPIAFRGSYAAPLVGCLRFEGWADTIFNLEFDQTRQTFNARIGVRAVNLKNVPSSLMGGGLTGLVQDTIDSRVNPVEILRAEQLGARIPVTRDSNLRLRAKEVRHEVVGKELRLHIVYEIVSVE